VQVVVQRQPPPDAHEDLPLSLEQWLDLPLQLIASLRSFFAAAQQGIPLLPTRTSCFKRAGKSPIQHSAALLRLLRHLGMPITCLFRVPQHQRVCGATGCKARKNGNFALIDDYGFHALSSCSSFGERTFQLHDLAVKVLWEALRKAGFVMELEPHSLGRLLAGRADAKAKGKDPDKVKHERTDLLVRGTAVAATDCCEARRTWVLDLMITAECGINAVAQGAATKALTAARRGESFKVRKHKIGRAHV